MNSESTLDIAARYIAKSENVDFEAADERLQKWYRIKAQRFLCRMGGESELVAFCEAVLATRAERTASV